MSKGWLRDLIAAYRWLWRAQLRWRPGPRGLAFVEFLGRVIADALSSILPTPREKTMIDHSAIARVTAILPKARILAIGALFGLALVVLGERSFDPGDAAAPSVAVDRVFVNAARMRVGPDAPPTWAVRGSMLTPESAHEWQTAMDDLFDPLTAGDRIEQWDLEPWRALTFMSGSAAPDAVVVVTLARPLPQPSEWPSILNPEEIRRRIGDAYPKQLWEEGRGGTVAVQFLVGADGRVQRTRIRQISRYPELDEAALSVAEVYRFAPATHEGRAVASWATSPVSFRVRETRP